MHVYFPSLVEGHVQCNILHESQRIYLQAFLAIRPLLKFRLNVSPTMLDTYGGGMSVLEKTLEEVISLNHYAN